MLNWNDGSNARSGSGFSLLSGTAPGGPGPGTLFHPFTFEYKNKDGNGNVTQFAIPYGKEDHCGNIYYRGRFSKAWTPKWRKIVAEINGIATIGTSAKSANLRVNGDIYATGNIEGHDFIFRDKETDKVLWRMVEDEKGLYLIKECNGKKYRIMMEEME